MASEQKFVDYIVDQIGFSKQVTSKKMFGEYGLYFDNKLFALSLAQVFCRRQVTCDK